MTIAIKITCPFCKEKFILSAKKSPLMHVFIEFSILKADWANHVSEAHLDEIELFIQKKEVGHGF